MNRTWRLLRTFLDRPKRKLLWLIVVASVASVLEAAVLVMVVGVALSASKVDGRELSLPVFGNALTPGNALLVATAFSVAVVLLHLLVARSSSRMSAEVLYRARSRTISAFASAAWPRQDAAREGSVQETVSTLAQKSANLSNMLATALTAGIGLGALILAAMAIDPVAAMVVLLLGGVAGLLIKPIGRASKRSATAFVSDSASFSEEVGQWSSLAMPLTVFGTLDVEARRLEALNARSAALSYRVRVAGRTMAFAFKDLAVLLLVLAVGVVYLVSNDGVTGIGQVLVLGVRAVVYAQQAQTAMQGVTEDGPNVVLLTERIASFEIAHEHFGDTPIDRLALLEVDGVSYSYGDDKMALCGVSFTLQHGECLGVIGPSGGGKSTLMQLLLRLRQPTEGIILVGGLPYQDIAPDSWHRLVAMVPQDSQLFQGSIADNIAFHRAGVDRDGIRQAAAAAHVLDEIEALSQGFDTMLGPRGTGLSGGQRQRVAIARALAGNPELLVLDEPTSALDPLTEAALQATIAELKGKVTTVIVAHRLSTLAGCDRVLALAGGRVRALGSEAEAVRAVEFHADSEEGCVEPT